MKKYLIIIVVLFSFLRLYADYDKFSLFDAMKDKYGSLKSVSAMIYNKADKVKAGMIAQRGNKYKIETKNLRLVSDGKTIWNYKVADKKVIISSVDSYDSNQSLDYIFFSFLTDFEPVSLQTNKGNYVLKLAFSKKMNTTIDTLVLNIDKKTLSIKAIQMKSAYSMQTWEIHKLVLNPKIKKRTFKFKIPKGTEVIDLR